MQRQGRTHQARKLREYPSQRTQRGMSDFAQIDDAFAVSQSV
jgi:hypothetical protein